MKKIIGLIVISFICLSADLPNAAIKKINKTISALWEDKSVDKKTIDVHSHLDSELTNKFILNSLEVNGDMVGYLVLSEGNSKADFFNYMVVYKPDLSILTVQVLVYREDYGGEIGSKRWLKQFIGKSDSEDMKFGHDIQNISGATISARSITVSVQRVTQQMNKLKNKGLI